ncbi:hypothetical protein AUJ14_04980 [Candidatus Micrarchaeota archaeon CG1_02_55_22]|nr:MAG: hypothetical protein AUJ14_04980 [Candidatus Micrarchaeota archaeon CG1_02_55_22]
MASGIYASHEPYLEYCRHTNEKTKLHTLLRRRLPRIAAERALDAGCGNGINTAAIAHMLPQTQVTGVDESPAQLSHARTHNAAPNTNYEQGRLESHEGKDYGFILLSHVLQYASTDTSAMVRNAITRLAPGGELWVIQQGREGLAQIITHQRPLLDNPVFADWKTFEDYLPTIRREARSAGCLLKTIKIGSSIKQIDFDDPSAGDKLRLQFILGLKKPFDEQTPEFKRHLARLKLGNGRRISHPNHVAVITRPARRSPILK